MNKKSIIYYSCLLLSLIMYLIFLVGWISNYGNYTFESNPDEFLLGLFIFLVVFFLFFILEILLYFRIIKGRFK